MSVQPSERIRVGLMGFGRIGRNLFRLASETPNVEIAVVSDIGRPEILHYLLQRDSIHGSFEQDLVFKNDQLQLADGRTTAIVGGVAPGDVNWKNYDVDIVVDATGKYLSSAHMQAHLDAGAGRVIIANLPEDQVDRVVIMGVNEDQVSVADHMISAGSSTAIVMALLMKIFGAEFDIDRAMMTTIHAFTSDQPLQDRAGKDFRRSRSAADNIIPNTTDTPAAVEALLPEFRGRLEGIALNVPVADGSCLDLTLQVNGSVPSVDEINAVVVKAARALPGIIEVTVDPIVSSDVIGNHSSLVFDTQATMTSSDRLIKVLAWYDNGWGHAARILDIIYAYAQLDGKGGPA